MKLAPSLFAAAALWLHSTAAPAQSIDAKTMARIDRILKATPLIDGHNDLPWELRDKYGSRIIDLRSGTERLDRPLMTDIERLRKGRVGAQFWSVYIPAEITGDAAIRTTIDQIDIVKRMVAAYPNDLAVARTADDIVHIHKSGRIASLVGIEGGHQIGNDLAALRQFYDLGARYMTLTHFKNNDWADSATDDPEFHGLSDFGRAVVHEMNRIGMLVDLAHVSAETMSDSIQASRAPVIFSHSDARALSDHPRNVPDRVLAMLPANDGVVMVNFYTGYLSGEVGRWSAEKDAEQARLDSLCVGQPQAREAGMKTWLEANPMPRADVGIVADHIEHIARVAGHDHVGIGGDLDGIPAGSAPPGLEGVDGYPLVFAELIRRGWSDVDLAKLAGGNLLRVLRRAEAVAQSMKDEPPSLATVQPPKMSGPHRVADK